MKLVKLYIALNGFYLLINSWSLVTDNTRNLYINNWDFEFGILGLIFGILLIFSTIGILLEKKIAYQVSFYTYMAMLIVSITYLVIILMSNPRLILESWIGSIIITAIFLINILTMYILKKHMNQF